MPSRAIQQTESGFTLIEVLVALFLLAGVALLLADLTCRAARITDRARRQVVMTMMAVERVEQLKGLSWGLGDAAAPVPVSDFGTDLSGVAPGPGGDGLSVSPIDSVAVNERGYVDFADRRGDWLGSGPTVPPGAAFVRRWRVSFVPSARPSPKKYTDFADCCPDSSRSAVRGSLLCGIVVKRALAAGSWLSSPRRGAASTAAAESQFVRIGGRCCRIIA